VLEEFRDRMSGVIIENTDALKLIRHRDDPDTLFYLDPPYLHDTRTSVATGGDSYRHEMTDDQHREMLDLIRSLRGMVILSGYPSRLYDEALRGWQRIEIKARASSQRGSVARTEVLWLSPNCKTKTLF